MYRDRTLQKRSCKTAQDLEFFEASEAYYRERLDQIKLQKKDNRKKLKAVERCLERDGSLLEAELEMRIPVDDMVDLVDVEKDEVLGNPYRVQEDVEVENTALDDAVEADVITEPEFEAIVDDELETEAKTVADFLATEESKTVYYILRGAVTEAEGKTIEPYGNFNLVDATGSVYVYGVLTVPKTAGRKPAILRLPGAAVRSFSGPNELAYEGFVVLEVGVHGIPVDQDKEIYRQLENGALSGYTTMGIDNRDTYYYKRSILGCVRAVDYLCTRDDVDTTRIATYGGSQGGMLSIMTAALNPKVSALFAYFPAFCDVTGYYHGRGAGWPHLFRDPNEPNLQARMDVSRYYDTVNFARLLRVPGFYAWGFNDPACCPTSTFSAYNVITAPKQLQVGRDTGHWLYPWQVENAMKWLKQQFNMGH